MKGLVFTLLACATAFPATPVFMPEPIWDGSGWGDCAVVGVSESTPAVIVVSRSNGGLAACGLTASSEGQRIWTWGIRNGGISSVDSYSNINGNSGAGPGDTAGLCRIVSNINVAAR